MSRVQTQSLKNWTKPGKIIPTLILRQHSRNCHSTWADTGSTTGSGKTLHLPERVVAGSQKVIWQKQSTVNSGNSTGSKRSLPRQQRASRDPDGQFSPTARRPKDL